MCYKFPFSLQIFSIITELSTDYKERGVAPLALYTRGHGRGRQLPLNASKFHHYGKCCSYTNSDLFLGCSHCGPPIINLLCTLRCVHAYLPVFQCNATGQ